MSDNHQYRHSDEEIDEYITKAAQEAGILGGFLSPHSNPEARKAADKYLTSLDDFIREIQKNPSKYV